MAKSCVSRFFLREFDERFLFPPKGFGCIMETGRRSKSSLNFYVPARNVLKEGIMLEKIMNLHILLYGMAGLGTVGAVGMLATHLNYRRRMKHTGQMTNLKEKWLNLWKTRDRLLNRMNRLVWYPSLFCTICLFAALFLTTKLEISGLPLSYLYVGAFVPVVLLLLRQALDFSYKEELVMNSLTDYVEQMRTWVEEIPAPKRMEEGLQEEVVEKITASICQTAATGSHFSKMLTPEEEEIMREIIREFM